MPIWNTSPRPSRLWANKSRERERSKWLPGGEASKTCWRRRGNAIINDRRPHTQMGARRSWLNVGVHLVKTLHYFYQKVEWIIPAGEEMRNKKCIKYSEQLKGVTFSSMPFRIEVPQTRTRTEFYWSNFFLFSKRVKFVFSSGSYSDSLLLLLASCLLTDDKLRRRSDGFHFNLRSPVEVINDVLITKSLAFIDLLLEMLDAAPFVGFIEKSINNSLVVRERESR